MANSAKRIAVEFTRTELDHLLTLLRDETRRGDYYGIRQQHYSRRDRLFRSLEAAYKQLTGSGGYPLKPSIW